METSKWEGAVTHVTTPNCVKTSKVALSTVWMETFFLQGENFDHGHPNMIRAGL